MARSRLDIGADCFCRGGSLGRLGATPDERCWVVHGEPRVAVTVISWDEAIRHMLEQADTAAGDLEQLHGACQALQGADVAALTEADLDGGWRNRKEDLRFIIGRVTEEAIARLSLPLAPWQANPSGVLEGGFRYLAPSALPNLAVGMRLEKRARPYGFAGTNAPPTSDSSNVA